jgi:PEP-CTERM motif
MFNKSMKKSAVAATLAGAALLGAAGSAQAVVVIGKWDPQYGAPFNTAGSVLGWQGTAQWFLPDACVPGAGTVSNSASCSGGGMTLVGATVDFYNYSADPTGDTSLLTTLTFGPGSATVNSMTLSGSSVLGVSTSLSSALTPNVAGNFDGINNYSFALQFTGSTVKLFYALNGQQAPAVNLTSFNSGASGGDDDEDECDDDDKCAPKPCAIGSISAPNCGVNSPQFPAIATFTTAVPEPQTYALMLAGLAALGFMARRRRRS